MSYGDWPRPMTRAEEESLGDALRGGGEAAREARGRLAACNLGIARDLSARYAYLYDLDLDDAFGAAQVGLLEAAERFDPSRGLRFASYAGWWVRQAVQRDAPNVRGAARVPGTAGDRFPGAKALRNATDLESSGVPGSPLYLALAREDGTSGGAAEPEAFARLRAAVKRLHPGERRAVERVYGLDGEAMTDAALARELGVTTQAIGNSRNRALAKLRRALRDDPAIRAAIGA